MLKIYKKREKNKGAGDTAGLVACMQDGAQFLFHKGDRDGDARNRST